MPSTVNLEWLQDPGWVYLRQHDDELLKEQAARNFDNKTHTWVANAVEGFVLCEQSIVEGKQLTVKLPDGTMKKVNRDECQEINPAKYEKTEDMSNLTYLNEASVLHNLRQRYKSMMIYTYSGLFCVFINPYKLLPIYTESVMNMYVGRRRSEMPPHLFAVSDQAYRNMIHDHENQSMLITGESGAGKTENTKKVIAYFAQIGAPPKDKKLKKSVSFSDQVKGSLEDQVVQANPAIEAFGNATTNRNLNSSRFGKFIRIHFNSKGKLAGGDIAHYLLEKSRVIKQAPGERSYHIFYQIMTNKSLRHSFMLESDIRKYHFVSQAEVKIEQIDDVEEFKITDSAFDVMGFSKEEKTDLYKLCAAIMHLGEMKFKHKPREEQAEVDNVNSAKNACHLFGINVEKFIDSLLKPTVKVGTEWVTKGQTVQQVDWAVGGLAKAIYARMFSWLIERCNQTLGKASDEHSNYIGVLDIAGFEIFDRNSFEQLWINFVNEKLQQFFNHHMFVLEQEEYQREGIKWQFIDFGHDLQHCIDLIEKPLGIVSMLDEECIVPKATDMTYIEKLKAQHLDKHPNFQNARPPKGKQAEAHFSIVHYAGIVRYNAEQWLEKNKDPLNDSAVAVLKTASKESLIFKIWESYKTAVDNEEDAARGKTVCRKKGKAASFLTVSVMYRESLNSLMHMLNSTHPHFIRCIIPNEKKQSGLIDAPLVLNQLTCNGVLEGIRICRKGFPNRVTFADFRYRYAVLAADEASQNKDPAQSSQKMLDRLVSEKRINVDTFRVGSTKVFFKAGQLAKLEEMRDVALTGIIVKLQSVCRAHMALCRHQQLHKKRAAIAAIQRNVRSWIALRVWPWYKLYQRVKPMIGEMKASKAELEALEQKIKEIETEKQKEVDERGKLQDQLNKQLESNENLRNTIEMQKSDAAERQKEMENLKDLLEQEKANALKAAKLSSVKENNELEERRKVRVELEDTRLAFANSEANLHETKAHLELQKDANTKMQIRNKALEHSNNELMDTMQLTQTKLERTEQQKSQLQEQLEETEKKLRLEKKQKEEQNKLRKKQEAELKLLQDQLELIQKERDYLDQDVKKRDQELSTLKEHSHQDANLISKLQINIRQLVARIEELEEEVDNQTRACRRAERLRTDAQEELNAVTEQMAIANGQLNAQIHLNRSRQNEVNHLHRELEKKNLFHETHIADLCNLQWHTLNNLRSLSVQAQSLELEASRVLGMRKSEPNLAQYNTIADSDEDEETTSHV